MLERKRLKTLQEGIP